MTDYHAMVQTQREFFHSGTTLDIAYRKKGLIALSAALARRERDLFDAMTTDLGRPALESLTGETNFLRTELTAAIKHLGRWAKPSRVSTPLVLQPGRSTVVPRPLGCALVIAPWNYPLQLAAGPMVSAIAAGNCVIVKPSELTPATSNILAQLVSECFEPNHVTVVQGGPDDGARLLENKFDIIFFTGSKAVGAKLAQVAATTLTPIVLELGGKSPCVVDATADLDTSARRLIWGKCFNAGQSCVAPDYVLVHGEVHDAFVDLMKRNLLEFYGSDPLSSPDLGRIVNDASFNRLRGIIEGGNVYWGGQCDEASGRIAPTILTGARLDDPSMQEEIFGPVLPVLTWADEEEIPRVISAHPSPLAMYVFTRRRAFADQLFASIPAGGGCVNDVLVHFVNGALPLGGVGTSGMGRAHGEWGFNTFSHFQGLVRRPYILDLDLRYPPYKGKMRKLRKYL